MQFGNDWDAIMAEEMEKDYYLDLRRLLLEEYAHQRIFPEAQNIFRAMRLTSFGDTKVVILGQDPYHGEGQAQGLSFSVPKGMKLPPSLVNISMQSFPLGGITLTRSSTCSGSAM